LIPFLCYGSGVLLWYRLLITTVSTSWGSKPATSILTRGSVRRNQRCNCCQCCRRTFFYRMPQLFVFASTVHIPARCGPLVAASRDCYICHRRAFARLCTTVAVKWLPSCMPYRSLQLGVFVFCPFYHDLQSRNRNAIFCDFSGLVTGTS
jgi:hypothetical protein